MTEFAPFAGLAGGILIGLSAVLLMLTHGRIAGPSGIFGGLLTLDFGEKFQWRLIFLAGLLIGAGLSAAIGLFDPSTISFAGGLVPTAVAGVIVGAGTSFGAGCTGGHGICGMARLSRRSIASTAVFMAVAIATVFVTRHVLGG